MSDPDFVATQEQLLLGKLERYHRLDRQTWPPFYIHAKWQAIRHIKRALRAIKTGTYGQCQKCHEPIDRARLEAVPGAIYCITCAEQQERGSW